MPLLIILATKGRSSLDLLSASDVLNIREVYDILARRNCYRCLPTHFINLLGHRYWTRGQIEEWVAENLVKR